MSYYKLHGLRTSFLKFCGRPGARIFYTFYHFGGKVDALNNNNKCNIKATLHWSAGDGMLIFLHIVFVQLRAISYLIYWILYGSYVLY